MITEESHTIFSGGKTIKLRKKGEKKINGDIEINK